LHTVEIEIVVDGGELYVDFDESYGGVFLLLLLVYNMRGSQSNEGRCNASLLNRIEFKKTEGFPADAEEALFFVPVFVCRAIGKTWEGRVSVFAVSLCMLKTSI
jgi:hypothetical protein